MITSQPATLTLPAVSIGSDQYSDPVPLIQHGLMFWGLDIALDGCTSVDVWLETSWVPKAAGWTDAGMWLKAYTGKLELIKYTFSADFSGWIPYGNGVSGANITRCFYMPPIGHTYRLGFNFTGPGTAPTIAAEASGATPIERIQYA